MTDNTNPALTDSHIDAIQSSEAEHHQTNKED